MDTYLPVGTLIRLADINAMIIGFGNKVEDDKIIDGYLIVKHPIGYIDIESVGFISADASFDVIHEGFHYKEADEYLLAQKNLSNELKPLGAKLAGEQFDLIKSAFDKEGVL